jgi:O-antigen/teichoic acid export membrane protein
MLQAFAMMDKLYYAVGQVSLTGVMFLFNLIAAKLLGPEQMGAWQTIFLISTYGMFLSAGIINGMGRDVPYYRGKGDDKKLRETIATTLNWLLLVIAASVAVAAAGYLVLPDNLRILIVMGSALVGARLANVFSTILIRSFRDFRLLGLQQGTMALFLLLALGPLSLAPRVGTVFWVVFLAYGVVLLYSRKYLHIAPRSRQTFHHLVGVGFPIYLVGLLFTLLTTVDRMIVLGFLGMEQLGLYTMATTALAVLLMVPSLVSNVMYPKIAEHYGSTGRVADLLPLLKKMIRLNLLFTVPLAAVTLVVLYFYIVPVHLNDYMAGRDAMAIIFLAALIYPLGTGVGDFFNVIGLQRVYLRNIVAGFAVNAGVGLLLVAGYGMELKGTAIGTVCGLLVFTLLQLSSCSSRISAIRHDSV